MMKVKRFGSIVLSAVLLSVFVYWATKRVSIFAFASETPSVRPFVATLAEYHIADGQQKLADTIIFARRSDGATSKLGTFYNPDGSVKVAVRRVEMPDGWIGMVIDTIHAKSTGRKPAANLAAAKKTLLSPPVQCLYNGETVDGTGAFFGQHALRIGHQLNTLTRTESWRLPDFNCASVGGSLEKRSDTSSGWHVVTTKVLTSFLPLEPDVRMFTGWDEYKEMNLSGLKGAIAKGIGLTPEKCPNCYTPEVKGDETYAEWNKQ